MKDYIKDGFEKRLGSPAIYDNICRALEKPGLTEEEREELLVQKDKAKNWISTKKEGSDQLCLFESFCYILNGGPQQCGSFFNLTANSN